MIPKKPAAGPASVDGAAAAIVDIDQVLLTKHQCQNVSNQLILYLPVLFFDTFSENNFVYI